MERPDVWLRRALELVEQIVAPQILRLRGGIWLLVHGNANRAWKRLLADQHTALLLLERRHLKWRERQLVGDVGGVQLELPLDRPDLVALEVVEVRHHLRARHLRRDADESRDKRESCQYHQKHPSHLSFLRIWSRTCGAS